jgi:hypothetical protein
MCALHLCRYWNYLRRQLFVLDTYYNDSNRVANHTLMALHSYGSAVFTVAVAAALLQLLLLAAMVAGCCCCLTLSWQGPSAAAAATGSGLLSNWGTGELAGVITGSLAWGCEHLSAFSSSSLLGVLLQAVTTVGSPGLCVFVLCVALAQLSIWFMVRQCLGLLHELSPAAAAADGANADGADVGAQQQQQRGCAGPDRQQLLHQARVSYTLLWAGWVLENSLVPACMAYTVASNWITWGGIKYRKAGGKVVEVIHPSG